jgi:hypothetical protein
LEVAILIAQGIGLSDVQGNYICAIAVIVADGGRGFAPRQSLTETLSVGINFGFGFGNSSRGARPVTETGLGFPVASCNGDDLAVLDMLLDAVLEDIKRKTESLGVEIEIAIRWGIVLGLVICPSDIPERRSGNTVLRRAEEITAGRIYPEVTVIGLGGVADIARSAAESSI